MASRTLPPAFLTRHPKSPRAITIHTRLAAYRRRRRLESTAAAVRALIAAFAAEE